MSNTSALATNKPYGSTAQIFFHLFLAMPSVSRSIFEMVKSIALSTFLGACIVCNRCTPMQRLVFWSGSSPIVSRTIKSILNTIVLADLHAPRVKDRLPRSSTTSFGRR